MAWYHDPLYRCHAAAAGLKARLYVSQAGRRHHFQTGSKPERCRFQPAYSILYSAEKTLTGNFLRHLCVLCVAFLPFNKQPDQSAQWISGGRNVHLSALA